jgi:hypothetical protein
VRRRPPGSGIVRLSVSIAACPGPATRLDTLRWRVVRPPPTSLLLPAAVKKPVGSDGAPHWTDVSQGRARCGAAQPLWRATTVDCSEVSAIWPVPGDFFGFLDATSAFRRPTLAPTAAPGTRWLTPGPCGAIRR